MPKTAVVTGAGGGIGRAVAIRLAKEQHNLVIVDLKADGLEETAVLCRELGSKVECLLYDISDESQVEAIMAAAVNTYGSLDIICHCAAIIGDTYHAIEDTSLDAFNRLIKINVGGTFLMMKYGLGVMKPQGRGVIIVTLSSNALGAYPGMGAYTTTKTALIGLVRTAAAENGATGVRVCGVIPGNTNTPMIADVLDVAQKASGPMGRVGEPHEVAASFAFLASDEASYTNGTILVTNGGMEMGGF